VHSADDDSDESGGAAPEAVEAAAGASEDEEDEMELMVVEGGQWEEEEGLVRAAGHWPLSKLNQVESSSIGVSLEQCEVLRAVAEKRAK
jgi:hypothetical protein